MKYSNTLLPCLLVISILILSSCRAPKELVYKDFKDFSVDKLGFSSSAVKMNIVYYNPNNFGLQLKRTDLDIYIDGTYLGHTSQEYQVNIPSRSDFQIPVKIDVDMKNIFKNALNSLFSKEVVVKVTGRIKLGKANVFFSMPVNYEGKQSFSAFK
jgi:LEA14-like dessication related protein